MTALRDYQTAAIEGIERELATHRSTLLVLPTGCGKTVVFAEAVRRWRTSGRGRALVLAHREELVNQAKDKIERFAGLRVGVEMGDQRGGGGERGLWPTDVVVGTVQSLAYRARRETFDPNEFGLIVVDEAHHATANSYRVILDYFGSARVLGVTATPDRGDGDGLGSIFESVAFTYEIRDAIREGYLSPIRQKAVRVAGLDLSQVRTTAGDLNEGDLEQVLMEEENLHGIAAPTVELAGDRQAMIFTPTVEHAHKLAEVIERYAGRRAVALDGGTDKDRRRAELAAFKRREFQYLVNCALFTEGFDEPQVSLIAVARPTKVRALYAQIVGRGTRPYCPRGCTTRCEHSEAKQDLLVLDFMGNAGKHALVTVADVLGASEPAEIIARANEIARRTGRPVHEAMDEAVAAAAKEHRRHIIAAARFEAREVDPFEVLGVDTERSWRADREPTPKQIATLDAAGIDAIAMRMSFGEASALIGEIARRRDQGLCTYKQARKFVTYGLNPDVTFAEAKRRMDAIAQNGWRVPDWLRAEDEGAAAARRVS